VPTKIEKDIVTGTDTTGHEWDGLKELNTPLPKWWVYILYATIAWSAVWFVLYPSVPGITGYFHGVLGYSQRNAVNDAVRAVAAQRAATMDRIKALSFADIRNDHHLWYSQRRRQGARSADATLRRRWHSEASRDPAGR